MLGHKRICPSAGPFFEVKMQFEEKMFKLKSWCGAHLFLLVCLAVSIAAIVLIGLDLLWTPMPQWLCVVLAAGAIVSAVFMWKRDQEKKWCKWVMSIFACFAAVFTLAGSFFNPYWNSVVIRGSDRYTDPMDAVLSRSEAKRDLDLAFRYLQKVHPALAGGVPAPTRQAWEQANEALASASEIDVAFLLTQIEGVFSSLGDAHTYATFNTQEPGLLRYADAHERAGDRLVEVNGISLTDILASQGTKLSYESPQWALLRLGNLLSTTAGLEYFGFSPEEGIVYTYETPDGRRVEEHVTPEDYHSVEDYAETQQKDDPFVSFEIDPAADLAILTLNSCTNNAEYQQTLLDMFTAVKEQGIGNVAVDLRRNGGGDSSVIGQFLRYIDTDTYKQGGWDKRLGPCVRTNPQVTVANDRVLDLLFDGNLYAVTSPATFSAGTMFAETMQDNDLGLLIGESPGSDPNGYGDIARFILPGSGLYLQISTSRLHRIDDKDGMLEPDLPAAADTALDSLRERLAA